MNKQVEALQAENAKLKEVVFGKAGLVSGMSVLEKALSTATKADHSDAPFPLNAEEAKLWHRAQAEAYQHALEMVGFDIEGLRQQCGMAA